MKNKYIIYASITTVFLLLMVATVNLVIDPYGVFRIVEIPNINLYKPAINVEDSRSKFQAVSVIKPQSLVLGSSRTELGIDPDNPVWLNAAKPTYNLSLVSGSMAILNEYLQQAHSVRPIRNVLLGVDLIIFKEEHRDRATITRLQQHKTALNAYSFNNVMYQLLSLDALKSSINTVLEQGQGKDKQYYFNGRRSEQKYVQALEKRGHRKLFLRSEAKYANLQFYKHAESGSFLYDSRNRQSRNLEAFEKLIEFCAENNIQITIFINPIHARQQELIYQEGLWAVNEQWKRQLVKIVDAVNQRQSLASPIPIWDFSGYNTVTMESVPMLDDTQSRMKWYWESSHYTVNTGDLILKRLFDVQTNEIPSDFGTELKMTNIEQHLQKIRNDRNRYFKNNYKDVDEVRKLVHKRNQKEKNPGHVNQHRR